MSIEQVDSRTEFINQVARSIADAQNDGARTESFIFGLSAKWGEGKTTFLMHLRERLDNSEVIEVNPWKYGDNKVTFLQSFLLELLEKSNMHNKDKTKSDILQTKTENRLKLSKSIKWFLIIAVAVVISIILNLLPEIWEQIPNWLISIVQFTLTVAIIPWMMSLFEKTTTSTVTDKTTSALISFDDHLTEILNSYSKNIVVFVDDLDRISAKNAILVLDNLRTFFDRKELCFIVSGDHSVIERHLGSELLPGDSPQECLEEGRRYLKKVFNIYWRMPIPIDIEIETYISAQIESKLAEFHLIESEIAQLSTMLNELFDNNYRNIERIIAQIAFTLRIVNAKFDNCQDETKMYYEDLRKHKMLLIKVILIQELSNPYYEYLLKHDDCLRLSDKYKEITYVTKQSEEPPKILSDDQKNALLFLIKTDPKFHGENGLVVCDMKPFIYLSADSSFGDNRGLLPSEFDAKLYSSLSDSDGLELLLNQHSLEMLHKGIDATFVKHQKALKDGTRSDEVETHALALIKGLTELGDEYAKQKEVFNSHLNKEFLSNFINSETYPELLQAYGAYFENHSSGIGDDIDLLLAYDDTTHYIKLIEYAASLDTLSPLYSNVLWGCFEKLNKYYDQFVVPFGSIIDKLPVPVLADNTITKVATAIHANFPQETAIISARILFRINDKAEIDGALNKMETHLNQLQPQALEIVKILDYENFDTYLKGILNNANDYQKLAKGLKFTIDGGLDADIAWQYVLDNKTDILVEHITTDFQRHGGPKSPSPETAKLIAQRLIRYAKENSENTLLTHIAKGNYLFVNLNGISGDSSVTKYLNRLKASGDPINSENAKRILALDTKAK